MNRSNNCDDYIYELLNYADVEDIESNDLDEITAKRIKLKINKKIKRKKFISAKVKVAIATIFVATNVVMCATNGFSVYANIGKSMIRTFRDVVGDHAEYDKYSKNVDLSCYDKGIKVVVNEVVTDGNEINLSYSLISDGKMEDIVKHPNVFMCSFSINGEQIGGNGGSGKMVSDNRYDGYLCINGSAKNIPSGSFYLDMKVICIDELEGDWKLKIKVDKTDIGKKVKEYNVNRSIKISDTDTIEIGDIRTTPLSTAVEIIGDMEKCNFFLLDDKGNEILAKGASSENGKGIMNFTKLINDDIKSLTFIPYDYNENYRVEPRIYDIKELPIELPQGDIGKLIVNKIEWIDDSTMKINYDAEGMMPVTQSHYLSLFDEEGNFIDGDRFNTRIDEKDQKHFERVIKGLDKNKKYRIGAMKIEEFYKINEKYKFTIDLK